MKIGVLTLQNSNNYGAVLQTYALQQLLSDMGHDVEIIDYRRSNISDVLIMFKNKILSFLCGKPDTQLYTVKEFLELVFCGEASSKIDQQVFSAFRSRYFNSSIPVNKKTIRHLDKNYDYYIVGSDQVWNCGRVNIDTTFFLNHVTEKKRKISYAASFGISDVPDKYRKLYIDGLNGFDSISVREKTGKTLVKQLINRDVPVVLDPTLLLNSLQWNKIATKKEKPNTFILVYHLGKSDNLLKIARAYSQEKGLPIVFVRNIKGMLKEEKLDNGTTPEEWLALIRDAAMIFTNSFHGVIFSINFQKEFFAIMPEDSNRQAMSCRIPDLLSDLGISQRYISSFGEIEQSSVIAYKDVEKKLDDLRNDSYNFLTEVLTGGK